MNLIFDVKEGAGMVDFPWQTPTELTYKVLALETKEEQLSLLREWAEEHLYSYEPANTRERGIASTMAEVEALMASPNLELSLI